MSSLAGVQQPVVRSEVKEVSFSLLCEEEIRKLSVCQITSPVAFDALGNPLVNGLYDPRLGPTSQHAPPCKTCEMPYINCPGHHGLIELCVPVYHPLLFLNLYQLLRAQCANCHRFRLSAKHIQNTLLKLKLLHIGQINAVDFVDRITSPPSLDDSKEALDIFYVDLAKKIQEIEEIYVIKKDVNITNNSIRTAQREVIGAFLKMAIATKKCDSCSSFSPSLRRDGFSKIFCKPLQKRMRKSMAEMKIKLRSALESSKSALNASDDENTYLSDNSDSASEIESITDITEADKYLAPIEVEQRLQLLWSHHSAFLNFIWGRSITFECQGLSSINAWKIFFVRNILVPPSRFRPIADVGAMQAEHPQNIQLSKVLMCNQNLLLLNKQSYLNPTNLEKEENGFMSKLVSTWLDLQNAVNIFIDSAKDNNSYNASENPAGIRQILERKEGLFRRHMMGKRVNFCCRSVISPDPNIGTNEIGIPVYFAKTLYYPTPVTMWNVKLMRQLVENGPNIYPGANQIETGDGKIIKLEKFSRTERIAKSQLLLTTPGIKVYRHLMNGDLLLVNRQPTLHKPGVMAHRARVLCGVQEKTLRMNYANCNSYNADFDGDEMNCHFLQNELGRAEASTICITDNQYIVPTSGNPLRGLIQDHVASGVKLTNKNVFLSKEEFQQLVYVAVSGLNGTEIVCESEKIVIPPPCILKPKQLWSGKQIISTILSHLCKPPLPPLHLDGKTRTPPFAFGASQMEHLIIVRYGELLSGVLDKASIGNSALGIVHAIYELYGADYAAKILNSFGLLFTKYLQISGHTCGIQDLLLTKNADAERSRLLARTEINAMKGMQAFLTGQEYDPKDEQLMTESEIRRCRQDFSKFMTTERSIGKNKIDSTMQGVVNKSASDIIKACLPSGLTVNFPINNFSMMVLTGAKGSAVNQSQISCILGQQALEGQRVPIMISGKSLPSFSAYDIQARAAGFISDRFLTGIRPQEYYFHCMAGREGLVDTAVKTSRSGYLQRCLVKHLEELRIHYDMTVRDSGNNVIQFLYGEDGVDVISASLLQCSDSHLQFLARNNQAMVHKYAIHSGFFDQGFEIRSASCHLQRLQSASTLTEKLKKQENGESYSKNSLNIVFRKGDNILAKKRINADKPWTRQNMEKKWFLAEISKVRLLRGEESNPKGVSYDLQYEDGTHDKHVPACIRLRLPLLSKSNSDVSMLSRIIPLLKVGLPDPSMSTLVFNNSVGAISERVQLMTTNYITKNPDKVLTEKTTETSVNKESFQLLMWVKFLRSLASPGEAVGCVAAQSIGEPSTQMTLNTFHLAGHGGANVTLGIPRLREIIMTAAKVPKTPTMTVPLVSGKTAADARALALKLTRVSLKSLLSHIKGVEVGESIKMNQGMERIYRIRFNIHNPNTIAKVFGIRFEEILDAIKDGFLGKLKHIIQLEQSRHKDSSLNNFKAPEKSQKDDDDSKAASRCDDENSGQGDSNDSKRNKKTDLGLESENSEVDEDGNASDENAVVVVSETDSDEENSQEDNSGSSPVNSNTAEEGSNQHQYTKNMKLGNGRLYSQIECNREHGWAEIELAFSNKARRLLMVQLVEQAAAKTFIRTVKDIINARVTTGESDDRVAVQTDGVNFEEIWELSDELIDYLQVKSNDIWKVLNTFGVEAARHSIVTEIQAVFAVYGIDVNVRHLMLIADFMTRGGTYIPMNRIGMQYNPSPLLQMSFETTCAFLTQAAFEGGIDTVESPSAKIVMGSVPSIGTGTFQLLQAIA